LNEGNGNSHKRGAGNQARGHGEGELLGFFREYFFEGVSDNGAEKEKKAVIPLKNFERLGRGYAAGKAKLLDVDHLALQ
jgi:hypothetical protein